MNIATKTSLMGFLIALSAISASTAATAATDAVQPTPPTIEGRLSRLTTAMRERANQLPTSEQLGEDALVAIVWGNGNGRGGWADGGGFANWRNGWSDGGGFANWRNH
ncbi:MAG TPA: GrrA/OscA1 family cyclophane-containing rSAM-modified RiPP [Chroococcidiopsis sp.]